MSVSTLTGTALIDPLDAPDRARLLWVGAPSRTRPGDRLAVIEARRGRGLIGQLHVRRVEGREAQGYFTPLPALATHVELAASRRARPLTPAEAILLDGLLGPLAPRRGLRVRTARRELRRPTEPRRERELHRALEQDPRALHRLGLPARTPELISERADGHGGRTDLRGPGVVVELKLDADLPALEQLLSYCHRFPIDGRRSAGHLVCGRMPTQRLLRAAAREGVPVWAAGLKTFGGVRIASLSVGSGWPWA